MLNLIDQIQDPIKKGEGFIGIATVVSKTDPEQAKAIFQQSLVIANQTEDLHRKNVLMYKTAPPLAVIDLELALQVYDQIQGENDKESGRNNFQFLPA